MGRSARWAYETGYEEGRLQGGLGGLGRNYLFRGTAGSGFATTRDQAAKALFGAASPQAAHGEKLRFLINTPDPVGDTEAWEKSPGGKGDPAAGTTLATYRASVKRSMFKDASGREYVQLQNRATGTTIYTPR